MPRDTIKLENKKDTLMIAHRGLFVKEWGNSIPAFEDAAKRTHVGIECDIHVTKDKQFIVTHDDNIVRITGVSMVVEDHTLEEIRAIPHKPLYADTHYGDAYPLRIPTLDEYLDICMSGDKICVIELKNRFEIEDTKRVIDKLKEANYLDKVIFISFDLQNCIDIRALLPDQPVQFLTEHYGRDILEILDKYCFDLDVYHKSLAPTDIKEVHEHGHKVNAWTVDSPLHAQYLIDFDIDYITTNYLE